MGRIYSLHAFNAVAKKMIFFPLTHLHKSINGNKILSNSDSWALKVTATDLCWWPVELQYSKNPHATHAFVKYPLLRSSSVTQHVKEGGVFAQMC